MSGKNPIPEFATRENYDIMRKAQRSITDAAAVLPDADACGVECDGFRGAADSMLKQLMEIERRFFVVVPK